MKKLCFTIISVLCVSFQVSAQESTLTKIEGPGIHTSDDVYVNEQGEYFAKIFYVAFQQHITENINQSRNIKSRNIQEKFSELKVLFSELETHNGLQKLERVYPEATLNDTVRYSKKGKRVIVNDLTKKYRLVFNDLQSYQYIKNKLKYLNIRYIEPPEIVQSTSNFPNDPYYDLQWSLKLMKADKVFDITNGSTDIILGINDQWTNNSAGGVHEELDGKILAAQNDRKYVSPNYSHGPRIAAIAAAKTDNGEGVASLGGNFNIVTSYFGNSGLEYMRDLAINLRPDVINMSWCGPNYTSRRDLIEELLELDIVLVSATANTTTVNYAACGQSSPNQIFVPYPASYNFPDSAYQVIAVTATQITDDDGSLDVTQSIDPFQYEERFRFQFYGTQNEWFYNHGLSNDPISSPKNAFTDVAAPSARMFRARGAYLTNDYGLTWGATSEAAPLVTSLVGILLSVNPNLGVSDIYDIITSSTDYDNIVVPPGSSTFNHPDGVRKYNKYIGYGRINAYKAVLRALPEITNYTIATNTTINESKLISGNLVVNSGAKLTLGSGVTLLMDQGSSISVNGEIDINDVKFVTLDDDTWSGITFNSGSEGDIRNSVIQNVHKYGGGGINIYSTNNHIEIYNNTISNFTGYAHGIYISNSNDVFIYDNTIEDVTGSGISTYNSYVNIFDNFIKGFSDTGIKAGSYSTVVLSASSYPNYTGENSIIGGKYGFQSGYQATINAGNSNYADDNRILNQNASGWKHVYTSSSSATVYATGNYWKPVSGSGGVAPTISGSGTVYYSPYLTTDPNPSAGFEKDEDVIEQIILSNNRKADESDKIQVAIRLINDKNYVIAEKTLNDLIINSSDQEIIKQAIRNYSLLIQKSNNENWLSRLENFEKIFSSKDIKILLQIESAKTSFFLKKYELSLLKLNAIIKGDLAESEDLYHANILSSYIATENGNPERAEIFFNKASELSKSKNISNTRNEELNNLELYLNSKQSQSNIKTDESSYTDSIIKENGLSNYPNPFNPETVITFNILERGFVELVVFDLLGRKVATLINENKESGIHSVSFDASFLSSGIYIYRLQTDNNIITKRMTLIK